MRRAFLCGVDRDSGRNFEHRRQWVVDRIRLLAETFAIDVVSYAVMSNHLHLVLRADPDRASACSSEEVIERWDLIRYFGVFAPASPLRGQITPARRGKGGRRKPQPAADDGPANPRRAMTWAQRLRRVFNIDVETCDACGGPVKVIAAIDDPGLISKNLQHLGVREAQESRPPARGPPGLLD